MITFIKDSIRELKHVVWPTREETKKYFAIVLVVLVIFGIYLFIAGSLFSNLLIALDNLF
ncbi:MAG: preprotein translocase subunit SecE [Candidatus Gracilibacteria bacterium]|nr:preprotein translocase subunit SecE [Candidatus Gracilibacteria bacterium]